MSGNVDPIFSRVGDIQWSQAAITAANTAKDGTGTVSTVFTADGTNGGYVEKLIFRPLGTNVASVGRVFVNNGASSATPANNALLAEATLPASTLSETSALNPVEIPIRLMLPPGYKLNVVLGTAVAAGYMVTAVGGKY